jgi:hypothetical protein
VVTGVTGKNSKVLSTVTYRIKPFPKADVVTSSVKKSGSTAITVALPDGTPLKASFIVQKWSLSDGINTANGQGGMISANNPVLARAKPGQKLILSVTYTRVGSSKSETRAGYVTVN